MNLTAEQIDRTCDAMKATKKERDALRTKAKSGDAHALFTVAALGKRQGTL